MMGRVSIIALGLSAGLSAALATAVWAQADAPTVARLETPEIIRADLPGRVVFEHQCVPCHGTGLGDDGAPMLPGTAALAQKYQGQLPALLELREDMSVAILRLFVRRGSGAMPMFRKAELTDAQIDQLAEYIAATSAATSQAANAASSAGGPPASAAWR